MLIQDKLNKLRNKRGFTLVELMIVVAIIGVLAALAIYGVRKYLTNAKTAEARMGLGRLAKDVQVAYEKESVQEGKVLLGGTADIAHRLCSSADPVPLNLTEVANKKFQSSPDNWKSPPITVNGTQEIPGGWSCIKFSMDDPQYYQYEYILDGVPEQPAVDGNEFTARAQGDLDGDGTPSTLMLNGFVQTATSGDLVLTLAATISEADIEE